MNRFAIRRGSAALALVALCAAPQNARATLPEPVKAMIEAAIATGDKAKVAAVVEMARKTNPDDSAEIDALEKVFQARLAKRDAENRARQEAEVRSAGLFEMWSGKGQIGAFQSSGNADNVGITATLALQRSGLAWSHRLRASADYQRSNGRTSREQFLLAYEPRYSIGDDLFAYGLAQYERDRFQGFSARYSVSGGIGYRVVDTDAMDLSLKAGPAFRRTELVGGPSDNSFGGLAGLDFDWRIARQLTVTQDTSLVAGSGGNATLIVDSSNTSLVLTTGLEAKISDELTTRVSHTLEYDSNPPPGAVSTDTLTRFTLVYGF